MGRRQGLWEECPFELFDLSSLPELGLEGWLKSLIGLCRGFYGASGASLFLVGPDGNAKLAASAGEGVPAGSEIVPGEGVGGTVLARGRARVVRDPASDPYFAGLRLTRRRSIGSAMVVPLVDVTGAAVGLLNVSRGQGDPEFSDRDLRRSEVFGQFMAMAVANARLVKAARDAMQESERRAELLQAVLSRVPETVCVLDSEGCATPWGEALPARPAVLGAAAARMAGRLRRSRRRLHARVSDVASGRTWTLAGIPIGQAGSVLAVREETKALAAQAEAARERHLAEVGRTTAAVAHEIRNPLTGISAAAQMILDEGPDAREYAQIIRDEAERLEALCESFLDHARPMRLRREPTRLGDAARHAVRLLEPLAALRGIRVATDLPRREQPRHLDAGKVQQALLNIIQNAIQASHQGGVVLVRVRSGAVWVEDQGEGIEADVVPRLFSPFFTTKENGTGLGLANVRRIAEAHGGDVRIDSTPGQGTTVLVDFQRRIA
jgi:signal transduction histidine kinase